MADTFVKKPMVVVGTKQQVDAEMGVNDFGIATDVSFYTAEETDAKLADKQDKATAVNYDNITNCITEIPQDIKLEIDSNGYLILKAGSKLYVPNGAGVFDVMTVSLDTRMNTNSTGIFILFSRADVPGGIFSGTGKTSSGETDSLAGQTYHTWYDTSNNFVYRYSDNATTPTYKLTLPLAIVTMTTGGICTSIDKVFNGFGYIGSTIFALPGVKGLMPRGFNQDGTLLNSSRTTSSVTINTLTRALDSDIVLDNSNRISGLYANIKYSPETNRNDSSVGPQNVIVVGKLQTDSTGMVTLFETKTAFHAVDYNDFEELDNSVVHKMGDETVEGAKIFTGRITLESADNEIKFINPRNSALSGFVRASSTGFVIGTQKDGSWKKTIELTDTTVKAPTPASTSNSTEVATTAWSNAKFLPLAGGTMSGVITRSGTQLAKRNVDNSFLELDGGTTYLNGAYLRLDGKDGPELGGFRLATGNGSKGIMLKGTTSGSLQWNGKEIVRLEAEQKPSSSNNYTWYRKYSDGWVEQGGSFATVYNDYHDESVVLPIAMSNSNYTCLISISSGGNPRYSAQVDSKTTTGFTVHHLTNTKAYAAGWQVSGIAA